METIKINFESIYEDFTGHLEQSDNKRIIFTAPFGTGKSTFLHDFFEKKQERFLTIKLFPVNYSVSPNEDVFELIKYDILVELMGKYKDDLEVEDETFSPLLMSQMMLLEEFKITPLLLSIIRQCGKIGKSAVDLVDQIKEQYDRYTEKVKGTEAKYILDFLNHTENQKGSDRELDAITNLIKELVEKVALKKGAESILIVDDLDRLDPEHIFKLFNIFSAHYDKIDYKNKFGFSKVIFVCDLANIKKIFHHKYGQDVDFAGYADKFYTLTPYTFNNTKYIKEKIKAILRKVSFEGNARIYSYTESDIDISYHRFFILVKSLINALLSANLLNFRMLLNYPPLAIPDHKFYFFSKYPRTSVEFPIVVFFYFLKNFYGTFDDVQNVLHKLVNKLSPLNITVNSSDLQLLDDSGKHQIISYCLPFVFPIVNEKIEKELKYPKTENCCCFLKEQNAYVHYRYLSNDHRDQLPTALNFIKATETEQPDSKEIDLNAFEILEMTFDICYKLRAIQ